MDLDFPSGYVPNQPRRDREVPTTLMGFLRPYSDISVEVHLPGLPHPVRSASRVFHPPDGLLPPAPSGPEGPVPLMGFTLQSFSPSQSRTPFGAVALLPFLASRAPALRTRRPRCPAASGLCSPRGSVPLTTEAEGADALLGISRLSRAFPARRGTGFPAPSFLRFSPSPCGRAPARRSKALTRTWVGDSLAGAPDSLEVSTRDLSSVSPDDSGVPSVLPDRK
jgi:hypothetical protein